MLKYEFIIIADYNFESKQINVAMVITLQENADKLKVKFVLQISRRVRRYITNIRGRIRDSLSERIELLDYFTVRWTRKWTNLWVGSYELSRIRMICEAGRRMCLCLVEVDRMVVHNVC